MKRTLRNGIYGLMLMAGFVVVAESCEKKSDKTITAAVPGDGGAGPLITPDLCSPIPDSLQPPAGNRFFLQTFARGVQIYELRQDPADANNLIWVNIAPLATLYLQPNFVDPVIDHFAGPSWKFTKGPFKDEKVVARKVKGSTQDASAIQWLLLEAVDNLSTAGNPVTFVQRVCTQGGLAPRAIPDDAQPGLLDSVPYTASYLFYTKQ